MKKIMIQKITQNNWNFWTVNLIMRAKKLLTSRQIFRYAVLARTVPKKALPRYDLTALCWHSAVLLWLTFAVLRVISCTHRCQSHCCSFNRNICILSVFVTIAVDSIRTTTIATTILRPLYMSAQHVLTGTCNLYWKIWSSSIHMPLLMTTSAFGAGRRCWNYFSWCKQHKTLVKHVTSSYASESSEPLGTGMLYKSIYYYYLLNPQSQSYRWRKN